MLCEKDDDGDSDDDDDDDDDKLDFTKMKKAEEKGKAR
jgi:hypothetical protein